MCVVVGPRYMSNNKTLTVVNMSVLEHQHFTKPEVHTNILCFETDQLLFPLNSGKTLGYLYDWKR